MRNERLPMQYVPHKHILQPSRLNLSPYPQTAADKTARIRNLHVMKIAISRAGQPLLPFYPFHKLKNEQNPKNNSSGRCNNTIFESIGNAKVTITCGNIGCKDVSVFCLGGKNYVLNKKTRGGNILFFPPSSQKKRN